MYYSIFLEMENNPEIKKWLNMNTKDEITEILRKLNDKEIKKVQIVETSIETTGEYELIKRFIKETQILGENFLMKNILFTMRKILQMKF